MNELEGVLNMISNLFIYGHKPLHRKCYISEFRTIQSVFLSSKRNQVELIKLYVSFTEEAAKGEWSIDEATGKFQSSVEKKYWTFTFNEKVDFSEDIFKGNYSEKIPEEYAEYATRYDLTFLSPCSYQIRCKVSS